MSEDGTDPLLMAFRTSHLSRAILTCPYLYRCFTLSYNQKKGGIWVSIEKIENRTR